MSLTFSGFMDHRDRREALFGELEGLIQRPVTIYSVFNTSWDKEIVDISAYQKELNEKSRQKIASDIYIEEAFRIINDLIELRNK